MFIMFPLFCESELGLDASVQLEVCDSVKVRCRTLGLQAAQENTKPGDLTWKSCTRPAEILTILMVPLPLDGQSYGAMHSSPRPIWYLKEGLCLTITCNYSLNVALSHCSIIWQEHYRKNTLVLQIYLKNSHSVCTHLNLGPLVQNTVSEIHLCYDFHKLLSRKISIKKVRSLRSNNSPKMNIKWT